MPGKREEKKTHPKKAWLIPSCIAATLAGAYAGFCIAASMSDTVLPHTFVGNRDLGGLSYEQAERALVPTLEQIGAQCGVHLTLEDETEAAYCSYDELKATFDEQATAQRAWRHGHSGNPLADGWALLSAALGARTVVGVEPNAGWEKTAAPILTNAAQCKAQDFSYAVTDDAILMTKQSDGRDVNALELETRLLASVPAASSRRHSAWTAAASSIPRLRCSSS